MIVELDSFGRVELVNYTALDRQTSSDVLAMRNHEDIRKWMHNKETIQAEQHQAFVRKLAEDNTRQYFILRSDDGILGTLNFVDIDTAHAACSFGLYANPQLDIPGLGKALMEVATQYAKDALGIKQLRLHALNDNHRAIAFYEKCGFCKTGQGLVQGDPVTFFTKDLKKSE